ncbi:MAG: homoserine kinase [Chloroflexi bacterium]|nr:homoserine kinase [Chloroflexota bacterium]
MGDAQGTARVTVRVPATTANLGPGFDCLGLALDLSDRVTLSVRPDGGGPPLAGEGPQRGHNALILSAARTLYDRAGLSAPDLSLERHAGIPVGKGLGSSAAAIVAGLVAANELVGRPFDQDGLLHLACEVEGHPDNAAPALLGGLRVAVLEEGRVTQTRVPLPADLQAVLFIPDFVMPTHETRKLLPTALSRPDVVFQIGRAALLVAALATGDLGKLHLGTQDRLHQPARGQVFPAMFAIFAAAREAGALAAYLSGGGPTICVFTAGREPEVAAAMAQAAAAHGVAGETRVTRPSEQGAMIVGGDG